MAPPFKKITIDFANYTNVLYPATVIYQNELPSTYDMAVKFDALRKVYPDGISNVIKLTV